MKKQTKKDREERKESIKTILKVVTGSIICYISFIILLELIIPMILGLVNLFLILIDFYALVDTNTKFLGGCFFFVILWKVYEIVAGFTLTISYYGFDLMYKNFKQLIK